SRSRFPLELWIAALWIAVGFIGSLGMHTPFHTFLLENVPGFRATRAPARWAMVSYAGLVPWAAAGVAAVASAAGARSGRRYPTLALLLALALLDVWPRMHWSHTIVEPSPVDLWIARERAGPLYLLPFGGGDVGYLTIFRSTVHHPPTVNG